MDSKIRQSNPITITKVSPDRSPVVGFIMVADHSITEASPATIGDGEKNILVDLRFYTGNLESIRAELHNRIDEGIDAIHAQFDKSIYGKR